MIFLKKYMDIWYFLRGLWKDGLSKKGCVGTWSFSYYVERWYFLPKNKIFFSLGRKWKTAFPRKYMETWCIARKEKQETWCIGLKPGFSLNLFGWRYSAMNNPQYFVPFIPQGLCLGVCLGANKGNYLSIRG